tara:strand:- start:22 stop:579 length:558 start_codon:yes stop_codon:yes gene_type:complete
MAKIQVQGIGVYDDKTLKKKIIQLASDLQKNAKKGDWNKASENGIRALGRMWQAYQDWSRQNESITEGPDADLGKKLKQIQNQIYKLGHQYKSKANVPAMMRSFMLGVKNQLKKDKLTESVDENMYDMSVFNLAVSHMGKFEKDFKRLIKSANAKDKKKALELMKVYKKHWIEFSVKVKDILKYD